MFSNLNHPPWDNFDRPSVATYTFLVFYNEWNNGIGFLLKFIFYSQLVLNSLAVQCIEASMLFYHYKTTLYCSQLLTWLIYIKENTFYQASYDVSMLMFDCFNYQLHGIIQVCSVINNFCVISLFICINLNFESITFYW